MQEEFIPSAANFRLVVLAATNDTVDCPKASSPLGRWVASHRRGATAHG